MSKLDFACDIVYMFVGRTGTTQGFEEYDNFIDVNERALLNVLTAMKEQKSKAKIIFPSTRLVYKGMPGKLKEDAEELYSELGMSLTTAFNIFLRQSVREKGIPFDITLNVPNSTTIQAIEEGDKLASKSSTNKFKNTRDLLNSLDEE